MPDTPLPTVRRVNYTDHARAATDKALPGHENPGAVADAVTRLDPFQRMQTAADQLLSRSEAARRGEPFDFPGGFDRFAADVLSHIDGHAKVLEVAAAAARSFAGEVAAQTEGLVTAMNDKRKEQAAKDGPQLTTDGSEHPLQQGGYDADADPQLPGNISDVEALKEGKATRAQAAAIAKADAENQPAPEDSSTAGEPKPESPPAAKPGPKAAPAAPVRDEPKPKK